MSVKAHAPRNSQIAPGVSRLSRSKVYAKRALYKRNKKATTAPAADNASEARTVAVKGEKNGKERTVAVNKASRWYPAEDVPRPLRNRKAPRPTKIRSSITPGTVLILLAGRFRGKRVVFLKSLESGLLLVSGPYRINGVPLRRVNQAYVIATSTKVDISGVSVPASINDAYFKREKAPKQASDEESFFDGSKPVSSGPTETRIADQKAVDASLLKAVAAVPNLRAYLNASFSLTKGQAPHLLKF
ncbi:MAG: ribosomal protein L6e-domain-containing protein [Piptocephalis tieghemiana]|nr:MAG: ribosomal protein L6e-domain-containing protein [Piptocephalis tieghemiana]